jgi:serine/threonine-protein phosphatase 2B catalytic subunit
VNLTLPVVLVIDGSVTVTDMLAAVLNICTQEELNETTQESTSSAVVVDRDRAERRKVIKNKILAVGRISHMFSVLRYATVYRH